MCVSLPTVIAGLERYHQSNAFDVLKAKWSWVSVGSVKGAALGGLALGLEPTQLLAAGLGVILWARLVAR